MSQRYKERAKICFECPEMKENKGDPKTCGCVLYLKAKIPASTCPQNKW